MSLVFPKITISCFLASFQYIRNIVYTCNIERLPNLIGI